jgi:hypothetical protein
VGADEVQRIGHGRSPWWLSRYCKPPARGAPAGNAMLIE